MKASELRIGNLVNGVLTQKPYIIDAWALREMESGNYQNSQDTETKVFEPIPLTEEWLLKFGFEKNLNSNNIIYYILAGKCLLEYNLTHNIADIVKKVHLDLFIDIKYVHQLQNLYFALTGEELTFKSE